MNVVRKSQPELEAGDARTCWRAARSRTGSNAYAALKRGDARVAAWVRSAEEIVFSIVVVGELLFGFRNGTRYEKNVDELEQFLSHPFVTLLPATRNTADRFGRIAAALRKAGTPIPTNDIWIAAHAMETGAELVTFDRHFEAIAGLSVIVERGKRG